MGILMWNKPKKARSTKEHNTITADGAPPGVYVPNMSQEDKEAWKAKLIQGQHPRVEIRKSTKRLGTQLLIIVSLGGGFNYKYYKADKTQGVNLHMSANGPTQFTWEDWSNMRDAIMEAREMLESL